MVKETNIIGNKIKDLDKSVFQIFSTIVGYLSFDTNLSEFRTLLVLILQIRIHHLSSGAVLLSYAAKDKAK